MQRSLFRSKTCSCQNQGVGDTGCAAALLHLWTCGREAQPKILSSDLLLSCHQCISCSWAVKIKVKNKVKKLIAVANGSAQGREAAASLIAAQTREIDLDSDIMARLHRIAPVLLFVLMRVVLAIQVDFNDPRIVSLPSPHCSYIPPHFSPGTRLTSFLNRVDQERRQHRSLWVGELLQRQRERADARRAALPAVLLVGVGSHVGSADRLLELHGRRDV